VGDFDFSFLFFAHEVKYILLYDGMGL
jgi:hypothetical protein